MLTDTKILPVTLESVSVSVESISVSVESLSVSLEAISQSIARLPTRDEMNTAISDSFDELARMVAVGFKETNGMIYQLQRDFNGMESRFNDLEETVSNNYGFRLRKIESRLQMA
jgi:copper chaperone CopZ